MKILKNKKFKINDLQTRARNSLKRLGLSSEDDVHEFIEYILNNKEIGSGTSFYSAFKGQQTASEIVESVTGFPCAVLYYIKSLEIHGYSGAIRSPKYFGGDEFCVFINVLE